MPNETYFAVSGGDDVPGIEDGGAARGQLRLPRKLAAGGVAAAHDALLRWRRRGGAAALTDEGVGGRGSGELTLFRRGRRGKSGGYG